MCLIILLCFERFSLPCRIMDFVVIMFEELWVTFFRQVRNYWLFFCESFYKMFWLLRE